MWLLNMPTDLDLHCLSLRMWICVSVLSDQSSLGALWVAKDTRFLQADSEDSDQCGWIPRLIQDFNKCSCSKLYLLKQWHICIPWRNEKTCSIRYPSFLVHCMSKYHCLNLFFFFFYFLRGMDTLSRQAILSKQFLPHFWKGIYY